MNAEYLKQAALVVSCIPTIAAEERFAIKGGTGINLFELNLPRLSVDIDLTYTIVNDRETAIRDINDSLERIAKGLLALGHNRPLHELLNPSLQDHREIFAQQFAGMTDEPFTYEDHERTFRRIHADLLTSLTSDDKQHLLDVVSLEGALDDFGIPNLPRLPAVIWKQKNLEALRHKNPRKFAEQRNLLEKILIA